MTPEVTAGFAICFAMIGGLSVWIWKLEMRVKKMTADLENIAILTKANSLFIDGVKKSAESMREQSQRRVSELRTRTIR
jgi:hypothetical protein